MKATKANLTSYPLVLLVLGAALALIPLLLACSGPVGSLSPHSPTPTPRLSWQKTTSGLYSPLDTPIGGEKVTLEVAQSRLPFSMPVPRYLPGDAAAAYLAEVWVSPPEATLRSLALVYGSGVTVIVHQETSPIDWSHVIEPPFVPISVNGSAGMGADPGNQDLGDGRIWHYPGSVTWQVGSLKLKVYGEYPMSELLKVAESIQVQ